ncbi:hypothetical protein [Clostridium gasigenes]|uniref:hypothetical protein n=1 Tax=Clostridium gasigenes TaxID=94869 RepID=UPI001A9BAC62|nr:hypothetical protein [Clostridium gasigenes]
MIFEKIKILKFDDYIQIKRPTYLYIKITPHKSTRNYNSNSIAKAIAGTYKAINNRVYKEQGKLIIESNFKISYIIDIEKDNTNFCFLVPELFLNAILVKIKEVWSKATVEVMEEGIKGFGDNALCYSLSYKKEDALSLEVDRKSNEPLNSILSIMEDMQENDRVTIIYNFMPNTQANWKEQYQSTMQKITEKKSIDKKVLSFDYILRNGVLGLLGVLDSLMSVVNDFLGGETTGTQESLYTSIMGVLERRDELTIATKKKKESTVINTQILIVGESENTTQAESNIINTCQAYSSIDSDNELTYKKVKKLPKILDYDYNIDKNTFSSAEVGNFLQVPGRVLLNQFGIKHIDVEESKVPEDLKNGVFFIGDNTYKGSIQKAYLSTDKNYKNLTLAIIGPTRAGKTELLGNLCKDAINNGQTVIVPDFCGQCELSKKIVQGIDKSKIINISCGDFETLQGMGYGDLISNSDKIIERYNALKIQSQQVQTFINCINSDSILEPRMERYLDCASLITFSSGGVLKDVFEVLQDYKIRKYYINNVPADLKVFLGKYITMLEELDEWSRATKDNPSEITGTKISFIQGILNRSNKLNKNTYIEMMLEKDCSNNVNLVEEMQKGKLITIQMPETMFNTEEEKDIYCTYWLTKIWGALQVRFANIPIEEQRTQVNLIYDELYQVPKCQEFLRLKINQIAKKTCKPIISCHSLEQVKYIRPELKSANTSYMLISGCNKDNYNELKEELEPYELEDLLNLKPYYSLNLIKSKNGYSKFITELPYKE